MPPLLDTPETAQTQEAQETAPVFTQQVEIPNNSGSSDQTKPLPEGVEGWSWGGFLWNWIWAIGNNTLIGLLGLFPPTSLIISIILGIYGRKWAWQNKKWESVEAFNETQKSWVKWWFIINIPLLIIFILIMLFVVVAFGVNPAKLYQSAKCAQSCAKTDEACLRACLYATQSSSDSDTRSFNYDYKYETGAPASATPTPQPTVATQTPVATSTPTPQPVTPQANSNFQSTGTQTLENGVTAIVTTASQSGGVVMINITFTNTSASPQTANLIRVQMHDNVYGTGTKEGYVSSELAPNQSKSFSLSFDSLPTPPFKIQYAMPNGDLIDLGTMTP